ncbi:helix-turn-helix domain-containing protein [Sinobacterium caligoides]|nr:helix-turn-helix domain-containing protein [Sinobacterium caligoides]
MQEVEKITKPAFLEGWLSSNEVAHELGTTPTVIHRWAEDGRLPPPERLHQWRFWRQQDIEYIKSVTYCR